MSASENPMAIVSAFAASIASNPFFAGLLLVASIVWILLWIETEDGRRPMIRSTVESGGHSQLSAAALYLVCLFVLGVFAVVSAHADGTADHWQTTALKWLSATILTSSTIRAGWLMARTRDLIRIRYNWGGFGSAFQGMELSTPLTHLVVAGGFGLLLAALILPGPGSSDSKPPPPEAASPAAASAGAAPSSGSSDVPSARHPPS